ncbi:MAG: amino acid ABC transporter permease, partial [Acinetobacter sp.]|nr:amino acid ABC transporter permease [Acinetobacter sp.]MDN5714446.1 amino acid ABC transporter permease [Acinetobacter sp.]
MNYTWNWGVLWQSTGVGDSTYLSWILIGLGWLFV